MYHRASVTTFKTSPKVRAGVGLVLLFSGLGLILGFRIRI